MDEEEDFVRAPDEQRTERLIPISNYSHERRFAIQNDSVRSRRNKRRRRRQQPSEFITDPIHHLEEVPVVYNNLENDATTESARIEYNYDSPPPDETDLEKAIEESLKSIIEKEKEQHDLLKDQQIEEENRFLEEQIKLIEEQEEKEKLEREKEEKEEKIKKRYGIIMSILRRSPPESIEYAFYLLWTEWFQHHFPEKINVNKEINEWLHIKKNSKLLGMLQEDELL